MFAGHVGAALAIGCAERRLNVGVFVAAALLLDAALWLFVLLGIESVEIPPDFARTHQPAFVFPYSHGLLAAVLWSAAAALAAAAAVPLRGMRGRAAALVAAAVFSHWLLDALVHRRELPLAGAGSPRLGLALWDDMPIALLVEAVVVVVGLVLFLPGSALTRGGKLALAAFGLGVLAFTVLGMTVAPPPPSVAAMAGSSLAAVVAVCVLAWWLGRHARRVQA